VYRTGEPFKGIYYEIITKGGGKKNLEASVSLIRDSKGDILGFRGIVRDVTELRKAEKAVQTSEERFRVAAESSNDFIYEWDLQSGRVDWFGKAVERLGDMLGELPNTNAAFVKKIHPEELERITQVTIRHLKQGDPHLEEYRLVGKDGNIIHIKSAGMCLRNEAGRAYKWIGALSDITERKRAEEKLKESLAKLRKAMGGIIQAMALTVESKDPYTAGHQQRVSALARSIAQEMGLPKDQVEAVRMAGVVHDLGKISVPAEILSKPTKLSDIEFSLIKGHSQTSYDILKDIEFPWPIAEIALQHHERLDGSGYPSGLKGDQILIEAQILMVADVVEAIASHRPYRPAQGIEVALDEISKNKGKLYNPTAVDACLRLFMEKGFKFN
jgi:PAS domain S-box-containing protein